MNTLSECLSHCYNRWLTEDPQHQHYLDRLNMQSLMIDIIDCQYTLCFIPQPSRLEIQVKPSDGSLADNVIQATLGQLTRLLLDAQPQRYIQNGSVTFIGNMHILQAYFDLFKHTRPDLSYQLSKHIGTTPTRILELPIEKVLQYLQNSHQETKADIKEYITHEQSLCSSKSTFEIHIAEIRAIKQLADRIETKIKRLGE